MVATIHTIWLVDKILQTAKATTDITQPHLPEAKAIQQVAGLVLTYAWAGNAAVIGEIEGF